MKLACYYLPEMRNRNFRFLADGFLAKPFVRPLPQLNAIEDLKRYDELIFLPSFLN